MQTDIRSPAAAPTRPLRAEPRHPATLDADGHIRGVQATSGGLVRATLGSALAATAILVFFWLPAEYAIDPTGVGRMLGLTEMGEIKQQLYAEAAADDAALAAQAAVPSAVTTAAPAPLDPALSERLDAIETQIAAIAAIVGATPAVPEPAAAPEAAAAPAAAAPAPVETAAALPEQVVPAQPTEPAAPGWRDEVSYTLEPTEGIQVKLVMEEGAIAQFEWTANGAVLNYDTHGDGSGQRTSYEQGRAVPGQEGELVAAFTGNHGWFWRNRTDGPVTVTLRTRGAYAEMKLP
jgi:cell pole-organizing protein PopZ